MKRKPWYIWLSVLAFGFLWLDTCRHFKFGKAFFSPVKFASDGRMDIWFSALGNMFKLFLFCFILPAGVFQYFLDWVFDGGNDVTEFIDFTVFYLLGVYITYRHAVWREKNLPLLSEKKDVHVDGL